MRLEMVVKSALGVLMYKVLKGLQFEQNGHIWAFVLSSPTLIAVSRSSPTLALLNSSNLGT